MGEYVNVTTNVIMFDVIPGVHFSFRSKFLYYRSPNHLSAEIILSAKNISGLVSESFKCESMKKLQSVSYDLGDTISFVVTIDDQWNI